jgi:hypothetical protein
MMKKILFSIFLFLVCTPAWAANFYYVGADDSYPDLAANWAATSGGAGGAGVPNSTTDVAIFDGSSGSPKLRYTFDVWACDLSDFPSTKVITIANYNFNVRQNFVGNANSPFSGTTGNVFLGYLTNTATWTLAGITIDARVTLRGTGTKTLTGTMTVVDLLTVASSSNHTLNGSGTSITCQNGVTFGSTVSGTTTFHFAGGTVQSSSATVGGCNSPKTVTAGAGTVTFGAHFRNVGNFSYISGTVVTTGNTFYSLNAGLITTVNGAASMEFNNFIQTNNAFTIGSDLTINGLFTVGSSDQTLGHASHKIYAKGGVTAAAAYITFTGAGLWVQGGVISSAGGHLLGNITFDGDCSFGTATTMRFRNCTLAYNSGTVTTTGALISFSGTCNIGVGANVTWDNLIVSNRSNSLTSQLNATDDLVCNALYLSPENMLATAAVTLNISTGKKVTTNELFIAENEFTVATISSAGTGYLYCTGTFADRKVYGCILTNIDASETATPIFTWQGAVTNCVNIYAVDGEDIGGGGVSVGVF